MGIYVEIISINTFYPAGHGTFFAGDLIRWNDEKVIFSWVYDCGSKRRSWLSDLIESYKYSRFTIHSLPKEKHEKIDMLCISHFDADHVNGLEKLLSEFSVDTLVLPYLPLNTRLEIALALDLDATGDTSAMLFTIDPIGFLSQRGYLEKISKILFIKGSGPQDGPVQYIPDDINPRDQGGDTDSILKNIGTHLYSDENYSLGENNQLKIWSLDDKKPIQILGCWEFVFFNKELPDGLAPISKATLTEIQNEVSKALDDLNLTGKSKPTETTKWREKIRKIYDDHFGDSPEGRNDISLVIYSNYIQKPSEIDLMWPYRDFMFCEDLRLPVSYVPISKDKTGLMLTGDITLRKSDISVLKSHLGNPRWKSINLFQVPHHASIHSWEVGSANSLPSEFNVLCVPDSDKSGHHPHIDVLHDFKNKKIFFANYSTSVVMNFDVCFNI